MTKEGSLEDGVRQEVADSLDEELELEIDDARLSKLLDDAADHAERETLDRHIYFKELFRLQGELVKLQDWVAHGKRKIVVLFEGRDAAGKGASSNVLPSGSIHAFARWQLCQRQASESAPSGTFNGMSPTCRPVAKSVLFDPSWYNRGEGFRS